MTANELVSLLGRAWSRLLLYPGGLAAFGVIWLICKFQNRRTAEPQNQVEEAIVDRRLSMARGLSPIAHSLKLECLGDSVHLALSSIVPPWLALALLPLPLAVALPRQIDIVVALALLEWPNLLAIGRDVRAGGIRRLAATLNSYPPLLLATLALAQAGNSLELAALARAPDSLASPSAAALHWLGAVALILALPPALAIGPFTGDRRPMQGGESFPHPPSSIPLALCTGLQLRALGLVALAALPWAGSEGTGLSLLRMLGAAALITALLWGFDRLARRQAARGWAWAYLGLDALLLLALLVAAYLALQNRLA